MNTGRPAEFVAVPAAPPPAPSPPPAMDMLTIVGLVALLPAAQDGTATVERVTITSAGGPVGHAGVIVMIDVAF